MAYAVYTPEVRHPVEVPGDQEEHLVAWLTKRLGAQVRAPKLEDLGFLLVGGRLISSDDGPGALLMYENEDGRRVVLYLCENESKGRNTAFRFASDEGVSVFYWFDGPFAYALAGELDREGMLSLAEAVYSQIVI
jgi:anti-sigma factor RsiW